MSSDVVFDQVSKHFGETVAVERVSFTVPAGQLVTLLGPSGCGKTTTLRMLAGLDMPTSGKILLGEDDVTAHPPHQRDVAMVFQSYALFPHMTVGENVGYGLKMSKVAKADIRTRMQQALEQVGLSGYDKRLPSELSGGQQQRVAVARALVLEPRVLLFDEPLSNLDARLRRRMRSEIRQLQQRLGLTVVYVTHDQEEAMAVSDQIIVMESGDIAQCGTPMQLYREPSNPFVANFIGDANLVAAEITAIDGTLATVRIGDSDMQLASRGLPTGAATVALRPNGIRLSVEGDSGLAGEVVDAAFLGSHSEYTLQTPVGELFVIDHHFRDLYPVGQRLQLTPEAAMSALVPEP